MVRFWDDVGGFWIGKNEEKCGRVCLFLSFGAFKMGDGFESILEASGASFSEFLGRQKSQFSVFFFGV